MRPRVQDPRVDRGCMCGSDCGSGRSVVDLTVRRLISFQEGWRGQVPRRRGRAQCPARSGRTPRARSGPRRPRDRHARTRRRGTSADRGFSLPRHGGELGGVFGHDFPGPRGGAGPARRPRPGSGLGDSAGPSHGRRPRLYEADELLRALGLHDAPKIRLPSTAAPRRRRSPARRESSLRRPP